MASTRGIFKEMSVDYFNSMVMAELDATVRYAARFGAQRHGAGQVNRPEFGSVVEWSGEIGALFVLNYD